MLENETNGHKCNIIAYLEAKVKLSEIFQICAKKEMKREFVEFFLCFLKPLKRFFDCNQITKSKWY